VQIFFASPAIRKLCEHQQEGERRLGAISARRLRTRLSEIAAARSVRDLLAGDPHPLVGKGAGLFAMRLHGGHRLVFEPADDQVPLLRDVSIDWWSIQAVRIVYIGDYHG